MAEKRAKSAEAQAEAQIQAVQQEAAIHIERYKQQWKIEFEKRRKLHNLVSIVSAFSRDKFIPDLLLRPCDS